MSIIQVNSKLAIVDRFKKSLRRYQLRAIRKCFDDFNNKGGGWVPLQNGRKVHFSRACILAIYGDFPAARKVTETGSSCPQCFTRETDMSQEPQCPLVLRTCGSTRAKKRELAADQSGATTVKKKARYVAEATVILTAL